MNRIGQVISTVVGLIVLIALLAAGVLLFVLAVREGSTFWAATLAAAATVAGAILVRSFERRRVADAIRRERLADIYMEMAQVLHGRTLPEDEREKLVGQFLRQSLVYASPKTLKAFRFWSVNLPAGEWTTSDHRENSLRYETFVKGMRDDLGISNKGLSEGDLARMGISDWDNPDLEEGSPN